jgi:hypothetical protein
MIAVMPVFCLSLHAAYVCRHSGACCRAGWEIPAEPAVVEVVGRRVVVQPPPRGGLFRTGPDGRAVLARRAGGACVLFEDPLCAVHRQAGPDHLPSACRHFPRVVLRDPRGTFVTLSHFCPTAAATLLDAPPLAIVEAPPGIALDGRLDGLDATAVLPPLLRPGVLMDYEGLSSWERAGVAVLDRDDLDADAALQVIAEATGAVMRWSPGTGSLSGAVERAFDRALGSTGRRREDARAERPLRAFVAAHLFASWAVYQSGGLGAIVEAVRAALATLRSQIASQESLVEAVRAADLRLRHAAAIPDSTTPEEVAARRL